MVPFFRQLQLRFLFKYCALITVSDMYTLCNFYIIAMEHICTLHCIIPVVLYSSFYG